MEERTKSIFKVGDAVHSKRFGDGVVVEVDEERDLVRVWHVAWESAHLYNLKGNWWGELNCPECKIEGDIEKAMKESTFAVGDRVGLGNRKGTVLRMRPEYGTIVVDFDDEGKSEVYPGELEKINYTPVNPAHYQVAGIPEAIEIMQGLMTKEQFEGFFWGNIIKYAYRYGRKGDKAETAGKIKWYAQKLKELGECESE